MILWANAKSFMPIRRRLLLATLRTPLENKRHSSNDTKNTEVSTRKHFKSISVDPLIMADLDRLNLGYVRGKKAKLEREKRQQASAWQQSAKKAKDPFQDYTVRLIKRTALLEEMPEANGKSSRRFDMKSCLLHRVTKLAKLQPGLIKAHNSHIIKIRNRFLNPLQPKPFTDLSFAEVAFIGRSNCGKSTLLNAILGIGPSKVKADGGPAARAARRRRDGAPGAPASPRPGETRALAFYELRPPPPPPSARGGAAGGGRAAAAAAPAAAREAAAAVRGHVLPNPCTLRLVDMPGYGFAHAKEGARRAWAEAAEGYLRSRGRSGALRRVFLLLDARHGLKAADRAFLRQALAWEEEGEGEGGAPLRGRAAAAGSEEGAREEVVPPSSSAEIMKAQTLKDRQNKGVRMEQIIQLILTKADLVPRDDLARRLRQVQQEYKQILGTFLHSSSSSLEEDNNLCSNNSNGDAKTKGPCRPGQQHLPEPAILVCSVPPSSQVAVAQRRQQRRQGQQNIIKYRTTDHKHSLFHSNEDLIVGGGGSSSVFELRSLLLAATRSGSPKTNNTEPTYSKE